MKGFIEVHCELINMVDNSVEYYKVSININNINLYRNNYILCNTGDIVTPFDIKESYEEIKELIKQAQS